MIVPSDGLNPSEDGGETTPRPPPVVHYICVPGFKPGVELEGGKLMVRQEYRTAFKRVEEAQE